MHDPLRQLSHLQQALSHNKKSIGIFLGAGCPLAIRINHRLEEDTDKKISDPIIPDVQGLTSFIGEELSTDRESTSNYDKLIQKMEDDGLVDYNIEDILSQIRSLKQVVGNGEVRGFKAQDLDELDKDICGIIAKKVNTELDSSNTPYHNLAIWVRSISRDKPVHVFTSNYDLLMEQAFEETKCPYFDGFIGSRRAFIDLNTVEEERNLAPRWARFWKIHGSINWRLLDDGSVIRGNQTDSNPSYLIYPSHLKYDRSRKMPYLAMLDRLKSFLTSKAAIICIVGYSFNDEHINDVLLQSLQSNPTCMAFTFLYGDLDEDKYSQAVQCASVTPNLSLIAFDKGIIGRKKATWKVNDVENLKRDPSGILNIIEHDSGGDETSSEIPIEFRIGDFEKFGDFLREITAIKDEENDINE